MHRHKSPKLFLDSLWACKLKFYTNGALLHQVKNVFDIFQLLQCTVSKLLHSYLSSFVVIDAIEFQTC